jgi:hypothetical protein
VAVVKDIREKKKQSPYLSHIWERTAKGVFFGHAGLIRRALRKESGEEFDIHMREKATKAK